MLKASLRALALAAGLLTTTSLTNAAITDGKFGVNQIFDVQYYWSGNTLNASNFIAPYDSSFQHPTVSAGQYFQFIDNNNGTYGLGLYNADGTLAQTVHSTGTITALGNGAIFYIGSGFFGNVITPSTGYSYGDSAQFTDMNTSPASTDFTSYAWASTTPLTAGQTAGSGSGGSSSFPASNAQFQNGLTGWTAGGGTGTQASTAYTGQGVGVAVVSEMTSYQAAGSQYSWTVKPPTGDQMVSIQPTGMQNNGVNSFDDMCADLGISTASKNEIVAAMMASGNGAPTNAAWIKQDITLSSGQSFTMSWQYVSTDYVPFNDGSITSLVNKTGTIVATVNGEQKEYALLGFTNPGTGNYSVGSYGATGWQTAQYTANENGTYTLGFGAFNLSDTALSPILFVTKDIGTTLNFTTPFGPIAPNPGSNAPNNSGGGSPTVVSTAPGTPIVTSSSVNGTPVVTSVTNTNMVSSTDGMGNDVVTTYFTVTTTTTTPTTITTTTTPVTITTYSDGSTTSTNGTPVVTTEIVNDVASNTTDPAIQSVATTEPVATTNTTAGEATITAVTVNLPTSDQTTVTNTAEKHGKNVTVSQAVTVVTAHPSVTTTTTETPITTTTTVTPTTTTVDAEGNVISVTEGTPTATDNTITQTVTDSTESTAYSVDIWPIKQQTAYLGGMEDMMTKNIVSPFLIDPLAQSDGPWAQPVLGFGTASTHGLAFGGQKTVGENTIGAAGFVGAQSADGQNSQADSEQYAGTAYFMSKQDLFWVKAAVGASYNQMQGSADLPLLIPMYSGMKSGNKATQTTVYGDLAFYSANEILGVQPFVGATVINSSIADVKSTGYSYLSMAPEEGSKTEVHPYVGIHKEIIDGVSVELQAKQTPDQGIVAGGKITAKKPIVKDVSLNLSAGFEKGKDYDNGTVMVGLTWNF